jgi:hypothetical protein
MVRLKLVPILQAAPLALILIVFILLPRQSFGRVLLPIIMPSVIGIALFGFTLSYDGFARTRLTAGSENTLPLEIFRHDNQRHHAGTLRAGNADDFDLVPDYPGLSGDRPPVGCKTSGRSMIAWNTGFKPVPHAN